jgi:cytochrome c oxidase assembly protein subunit 15
MSLLNAATSARPWPRRLAWALFLATLPLLALGGTVTTLRAGMAIDGWWVLEPGRGDHFLLFYPLEKWFRDAGTFAEHSHRLFGTVVGLLAIAYLVASALADRRRGAVVLAAAGLIAVCAQGALGGFRVLENSPELAFLHGSFAQAVFALLACNLVVTAPQWSALPRVASRHAASARAWCWSAAILVYAQIVLGAWLRHSGAALPFLLHVAGTFAVVAVLVGAARKLGLVRAEASSQNLQPLRRARRGLLGLLVIQIALGVTAAVAVLVVSGGFQGQVSAAEQIFATAHVLCGALLLAQCVAACMWVQRATRGATSQTAYGVAQVGGAR